MARNKERVPIESKRGRKGGLIDRSRFTAFDEMDRLFNEFKSSFNDLIYSTPPRNKQMKWEEQIRPAVTDVVDHGDRFEMNVELPGISKDDVNIEVTPYNIEISAQKSTKKESKEKNWLKKESTFNYYRNFDLPNEIKSDDVEAELKDGILSITMPKENPTQTYKSKEVKIK